MKFALTVEFVTQNLEGIYTQKDYIIDFESEEQAKKYQIDLAKRGVRAVWLRMVH